MDFDPRDHDPRNPGDEHIYGSRWGEDAREIESRDRERETCEHDPRDLFVRSVDLPRGTERELVQDARERLYEVNCEDARMLATVGTFRVVAEGDLERFPDAHDSIEHLREEGLIRSVSAGHNEEALVLTDEGYAVLDSHRRDVEDRERQEFHAGVSRPRELQHDSQLFNAYLGIEEGLREQGAQFERVVLEVDLKREYQAFLQEHNRGRKDSDGRPDRAESEIAEWAREHDLPYFDDQVHFPDFRIEYELRRPRAPRRRRGDDGQLSRKPRGLAYSSGLHMCRVEGARRRTVPAARLGVVMACVRDSVTADRTQAVEGFGFTERQARFLVAVMVYGGAFLERQYCSFASIAHGQKTHDFIRKLIDRNYVTAITPGALHRGRLFHLHFKPLYGAIGEANNRNRRPATLGRMIERLMLLDAVLADRRHTWLGTERDKVAHFRSTFTEPNRMPDLPYVAFGEGAQKTVRYFPDKFPIGLERDYGRRNVFLYLMTSEVPSAFRMFLFRHGDLLSSSRYWTIRILVPHRFRKAKALYRFALRDEYATPLPYTGERPRVRVSASEGDRGRHEGARLLRPDRGQATVHSEPISSALSHVAN